MTSPKIIVAGTIGLDTITTPFGKLVDGLGGSAVYAALAASLSTPTGIIAAAGTDLPAAYKNFLEKKFQLDGLTTTGENFRWTGAYEYAMDAAMTKAVTFGNLTAWQPTVPPSYVGAKVIFIGNIHPKLQNHLLDWAHAQHPRPWIMLDTINYYIEHDRAALEAAINRVDLLLVNDQEARMLTQNPNLIAAGRQLLELGPQYVIIKKGEHGALLFSTENFFAVPGYPLSEVKDPTGAGDSFGGGIAGYVAETPADTPLTFQRLIEAVRRATVLASFTTESLGTDRLANLTLAELEERLTEYATFTQIASH